MHVNVKVGSALAEYLPHDHNGNTALVPLCDGASIAELLMHLGIASDKRLLIILNGTIVPTNQMASTGLNDGDQLSLMLPITAG